MLRTKHTKFILLAAITAGIVIAASTGGSDAEEPVPSKTDDAPLRRARKTVKMLDDIYKNAIVLITKTYVEDETSTPGIAAAMALWDTMDKKGWHQARLVDATGEPYDADNVAKTAFEKRAIKLLTTENSYIDHVVEEKGKRYLEAVTQVPVVMQKCTLCHPHYEDAAPGATIGAVSYRLAIDED